MVDEEKARRCSGARLTAVRLMNLSILLAGSD